jgi:hypothetical protein
MRTHIDAVLPNALASRIAISALMSDLPVTIFVRVCRPTPTTSAPGVTERPNGSRQAFLTIRPGWAGFFIGMVLLPLLMVVDRFNIKSIRTLRGNEAMTGIHYATDGKRRKTIPA